MWRWSAGMAGGKVWVVPLIAMVALRRGRSCLTTWAMDTPVRDWIAWETAKAVEYFVAA